MEAEHLRPSRACLHRLPTDKSLESWRKIRRISEGLCLERDENLLYLLFMISIGLPKGREFLDGDMRLPLDILLWRYGLLNFF